MVAMLAISCETTYKLVLDKNNPPDKNAALYFNSVGSSGWYYLLKWNDEDIQKSLYGNKKRNGDGDVAILNLPAGKNKLSFDVEFHDRAAVYSSKNVEFQYDFEAGKKYRIGGMITRLKSFNSVTYTVTLHLRLFDITSGEKLIREWEIPGTPM